MKAQDYKDIKTSNVDTVKIMANNEIWWQKEEKFYNFIPNNIESKGLKVDTSRDDKKMFYSASFNGDDRTKLKIGCNVEKLAQYKYTSSNYGYTSYGCFKLKISNEKKSTSFNIDTDESKISDFGIQCISIISGSTRWDYFLKKENGLWKYAPDGSVFDRVGNLAKITKISNIQYEIEIKEQSEISILISIPGQNGNLDDFRNLCNKCGISIETNKEVI